MKFYLDGKGLNKGERLFRKLSKELKNDIRSAQRREALPIWKQEINSRKDVTPIASRVYKSGISVRTGANLALVAKGSSKRIGPRRIPQNSLLAAAEFGSASSGNYTKYFRTSPDGKRHVVTRRTRRGLPAQRRNGYVAVPAGKASAKRIASLTIQTTIKRIHDAAEGR